MSLRDIAETLEEFALLPEKDKARILEDLEAYERYKNRGRKSSMTREEMLHWCDKLRIPAEDEDAIDRLYYLVALAIKQEREACVNDVNLERESWTRGRNDMAVIVCDYILQAIKKRGMA